MPAAALARLLAVPLLVLLAGCSNPPLYVGDRMPGFELSDLEGQPVGDEQLRGQVVVLHLFSLLSTDRVHAENPRADEAIEALKPLHANHTGVVFLSIGLAGFFNNHAEGGHATAWERAIMVAGFRDRHNATWAFASEPEPGYIDDRFGDSSSAEVFLFDADGVLRARSHPDEPCVSPSLDLLLSRSTQEIPC
jgi:hypothetical protein